MKSQTKHTRELPKKARLGLRVTKTFLLDVSNSDTIVNIKKKIHSFEGDSCDQQKLFIDGNHLEDAKTLADYNLTSNSIIDVDVEIVMQVSIKIPSMDKTLKLDVNCMDTVRNLKVMIQNEVEFPSKHQLLVFCGETLDDKQVLFTCGVKKDSLIYVMLNPLAEMFLYIRTSRCDFFSIEAMGGYSIRDVKIIVESLKGIPASRQKYLRDEQELLDSFSLSFYKIQNNSVIHLQVQMQIFVKIETGKTVTIEAEDCDTIAIIIVKIKEKMNLSMLNFKLLYSGKLLLKNNTLAFYGIQNESEIILLGKAACEKYIVVTIEEMDGSRPLAPPLSVRNRSTVSELKQLIEIVFGRKFTRMKLSCKEDRVELKDDKLTLADYAVENNAVLCLSSG